MGCASSTLLNQDDEFSYMVGNGIGHHIVSLTSTTYGLLTLDGPHPPSSSDDDDNTLTPPSRFTLASLLLPESTTSIPPFPPPDHPPEVINSWELMAGLDLSNDSFRFSPLPPPHQTSKPFPFRDYSDNKDNTSPNNPLFLPNSPIPSSILLLDGYEKLCPPKGENRLVIYTTTLRGVRKTFEACNAVRAAIDGLGVLFCERDISMDRGFKEELRELMKGKESLQLVPPRVFVKGRYIGGVEEVLKVLEEGNLGILLQGLPRLKAGGGHACEGCGGVGFLPCFTCNGSCKIVKEQDRRKTVVVRCCDCNENGLTICRICS